MENNNQKFRITVDHIYDGAELVCVKFDASRLGVPAWTDIFALGGSYYIKQTGTKTDLIYVIVSDCAYKIIGSKSYITKFSYGSNKFAEFIPKVLLSDEDMFAFKISGRVV